MMRGKAKQLRTFGIEYLTPIDVFWTYFIYIFITQVLTTITKVAFYCSQVLSQWSVEPLRIFQSIDLLMPLINRCGYALSAPWYLPLQCEEKWLQLAPFNPGFDRITRFLQSLVLGKGLFKVKSRALSSIRSILQFLLSGLRLARNLISFHPRDNTQDSAKQTQRDGREREQRKIAAFK